MASPTPDTNTEPKIPVPISLTATTPTLPPATQQALIAHLRAAGAIPELSSLLADSLARTGWIDRVRALGLELLRNGSCDTFPDLMTEVLRRAKIAKSASNATETKATKTPTKTNGANAAAAALANGINGAGAIAVSKDWSGGPDGLPDVRIPEATVDAGVEFLKEKIMEMIEVVDDDSD